MKLVLVCFFVFFCTDAHFRVKLQISSVQGDQNSTAQYRGGQDRTVQESQESTAQYRGPGENSIGVQEGTVPGGQKRTVWGGGRRAQHSGEGRGGNNMGVSREQYREAMSKQYRGPRDSTV